MTMTRKRTSGGIAGKLAALSLILALAGTGTALAQDYYVAQTADEPCTPVPLYNTDGSIYGEGCRTPDGRILYNGVVISGGSGGGVVYDEGAVYADPAYSTGLVVESPTLIYQYDYDDYYYDDDYYDGYYYDDYYSGFWDYGWYGGDSGYRRQSRPRRSPPRHPSIGDHRPDRKPGHNFGPPHSGGKRPDRNVGSPSGNRRPDRNVGSPSGNRRPDRNVGSPSGNRSSRSGSSSGARVGNRGGPGGDSGRRIERRGGSGGESRQGGGGSRRDGGGGGGGGGKGPPRIRDR